MKGIPAFIQTRDDLNNLFNLAQQGKVDKSALTEKINALLALRYHHIPILSINGNVVTTRFFNEADVGGTTIEGLSVTDAQPYEPPEDGGVANDPDSGVTEYTGMKITLSAAPSPDSTVLSVYKTKNYLTENGFDISEINCILEVLAQ